MNTNNSNSTQSVVSSEVYYTTDRILNNTPYTVDKYNNNNNENDDNDDDELMFETDPRFALPHNTNNNNNNNNNTNNNNNNDIDSKVNNIPSSANTLKSDELSCNLKLDSNNGVNSVIIPSTNTYTSMNSNNNRCMPSTPIRLPVPKVPKIKLPQFSNNVDSSSNTAGVNNNSNSITNNNSTKELNRQRNRVSAEKRKHRQQIRSKYSIPLINNNNNNIRKPNNNNPPMNINSTQNNDSSDNIDIESHTVIDLGEISPEPIRHIQPNHSKKRKDLNPHTPLHTNNTSYYHDIISPVPLESSKNDSYTSSFIESKHTNIPSMTSSSSNNNNAINRPNDLKRVKQTISQDSYKTDSNDSCTEIDLTTEAVSSVKSGSQKVSLNRKATNTATVSNNADSPAPIKRKRIKRLSEIQDNHKTENNNNTHDIDISNTRNNNINSRNINKNMHPFTDNNNNNHNNNDNNDDGNNNDINNVEDKEDLFGLKTVNKHINFDREVLDMMKQLEELNPNADLKFTPRPNSVAIPLNQTRLLHSDGFKMVFRLDDKMNPQTNNGEYIDNVGSEVYLNLNFETLNMFHKDAISKLYIHNPATLWSHDELWYFRPALHSLLQATKAKPLAIVSVPQSIIPKKFINNIDARVTAVTFLEQMISAASTEMFIECTDLLSIAKRNEQDAKNKKKPSNHNSITHLARCSAYFVPVFPDHKRSLMNNQAPTLQSLSLLENDQKTSIEEGSRIYFQVYTATCGQLRYTSASEYMRILNDRKLHLVLHLDDGLLLSLDTNEANETNSYQFELNGIKHMLYIRSEARIFLAEVSPMFVIYFYSKWPLDLLHTIIKLAIQNDWRCKNDNTAFTNQINWQEVIPSINIRSCNGINGAVVTDNPTKYKCDLRNIISFARYNEMKNIIIILSDSKDRWAENDHKNIYPILVTNPIHISGYLVLRLSTLRASLLEELDSLKVTYPESGRELDIYHNRITLITQTKIAPELKNA